MRKIACDYPSDQISGSVVSCLARDREDNALAGEEGLKIQNPPMVDVRVWTTETPIGRKRLEMGLHFFVDILLEIDTEFTIGPDDQIRADTNVERNITVGVRDRAIAPIIDDAVIRPFDRSTNEALAETLRLAIAVGHRGGSEKDN
jgi:hypothetical protein